MRFSRDCAERARLLDCSTRSAEPLMDTVERFAGRGLAGPVGYWTAVLAGESITGRRVGADYDAAFARERAVQARWLGSELARTD